ncbi:MAG: Transcriptional regulator KdgR [Herminiimonas sp.]|jgi:IclR family KDG regulon transcriptional repressor|nr:Transcriptional regulator KdgR [Herminiimonas sp.]
MERKKTSKPGKPKTRLSSVANAIRLIKAFSDDEYEIGISDLGKRLLLPKSTVHRLASTLIDAGMLEQNTETGKYRLGLVLFELGSLVRRKMDFSSEAKPYLMALREKTGETVHLAILDHTSILYINSLESRQAIRMTMDVGVRKPAFCTAEGKVLLAFLPVEMLERILTSGAAGRTPDSVADLAALRQELTAVRNRGYALDDEESELGMRCIAAPVRDHYGNVIAATSVAGPSQRLTKKILMSYAPDVVSAGEAISVRLGYQPLRAARLQRGGRMEERPIL